MKSFKTHIKESEQLDELSPSTVDSYKRKAKDDLNKSKKDATSAIVRGDKDQAKKNLSKMDRRAKGLRTATRNEEADLEEMEISVKSMKKSGLGNVRKANNIDKLKADIARLRKNVDDNKGMKPLRNK